MNSPNWLCTSFAIRQKERPLDRFAGLFQPGLLLGARRAGREQVRDLRCSG
jgi:hypothetical protein